MNKCIIVCLILLVGCGEFGEQQVGDTSIVDDTNVTQRHIIPVPGLEAPIVVLEFQPGSRNAATSAAWTYLRYIEENASSAEPYQGLWSLRYTREDMNVVLIFRKESKLKAYAVCPPAPSKRLKCGAAVMSDGKLKQTTTRFLDIEHLPKIWEAMEAVEGSGN